MVGYAKQQQLQFKIFVVCIENRTSEWCVTEKCPLDLL